MSARVLVTGATGSVGSALYPFLQAKGYHVIAGLRTPGDYTGESLVLGDITQPITLNQPVDTVVHCAALAHRLQGAPDELYHQINTQGTKHVIEAGLKVGMKRFVYLSTIKVLGEETTAQALTDASLPNPLDAYAQSKYDAEKLVKTYQSKGLETVIIRPPLVYGAGQTGNIGSLIKALAKGLPLPLNSINNERSMIHIHNLCSFIERCIFHSGAKNETFVVADYDFSTPDFIRMVARHNLLKARLFSCPKGLLELLGKLLGQQDRVDKLVSSLKVSPNRAQQLLDWAPDKSVYVRAKASYFG